jgi:hypothetical protein
MARIKLRKLVVWVIWCLAIVGLAVAQAYGWIDVPGWILVVFGLVLLVFGLVWWAVSREALLPPRP